MRILSWNVNGIRSLKKDIGVIIQELGADVACFQETKITKELMTEKLALVDGFRSYFSYSKTRAGYSGVVTYCRRELQPVRASDSLIASLDGEPAPQFSLPPETLQLLDAEGRTIITQHKLKEPIAGKSLLSIINLYCPCVTGETDGRELFRLQFLQTLDERLQQLRKNSHVVVLGDINISHKVIDSCDPGDHEEFLNQPHRQWLNRMLITDDGDDGMLVDTYRSLNPEKKYAYTCWNTKINARQTNFGTRIDYILLDKNLKAYLHSAEVLNKYQGSDHCPVSTDIPKLTIQPAERVPQLCSSIRYKVKQQKLTMFMKKPQTDKPKDVFDSITTSSTKNNKPSLTSTKKRKATGTLKGFVKQVKVDIAQMEDNSNKKLSITSSEQLTEISKCSQTSDDSMSENSGSTNSETSKAFLKMFSNSKAPKPVCTGHKETAVLQTVKKEGENKGRKFYGCARGVGSVGNKEARCSYFKWSDEL